MRGGFVSNSSSASFTIKLEDITAKQLVQIREHHKEAGDDVWSVYVEEVVVGHTHMDNFDMRMYLESIGVDMDKVRWGR